MRRSAATVAATALVLAAGALPAAARTAGRPQAAAPSCDPARTAARYAGAVPTPERVIGSPLGSRPLRNAEILRYLAAVDRASSRVVTGTFARSVQGRPLQYALVGRPATVTPRRLAAVRADAAALRNPATPPGRAAAIAARMPVILWVAGNVHGDEPSGADAVLRLLHDLADRTDCVASTILDNALVGLIPTQNPDGRAADRRTNAYAVDLNRDWFARTQPETRGKLDLLWRYPPQLFIDEHEMGGRDYFFPPNADPVYHETPGAALHWINGVYGPANAAAFRYRGIGFETYQAGYDLFYQGYGDTVPTTQFGAAGMTFEQGYLAPYPVKTAHHHLAALASLYVGATRRSAILDSWRGLTVQAQRQGAACRLQPNRVYNPGNDVVLRVPDAPVCGYFLRTDDPRSAARSRLVARRLQQAHVEVYGLSRALRVPDYTPYGRAPRAATLAAGTLWVPMAQAQKHWVQAMLNSDTYVPFPYFYDVSAWSLPLLGDVPGGSTGTLLAPAARRLPPLPAAQAPRPARVPRIAVLDDRPEPTYEYQTTGWLRWRLDQDWRLPYTVLTPEQVTGTALRRVDVLLVPDVDADPVRARLGVAGTSALRAWVNRGGRYVGWQGGTALAAGIGLSTVALTEPTAQSPGALFRVAVRAAGPLGPFGRGSGPTNEVLWSDDDRLMRAADPAHVVAAFPRAGSPDWYVSGYAERTDELRGTAVEVAEPVGAGSVVAFSVEPNFRGYTDGSAGLLRAAILAPAGAPAAAAGSSARAAAEAVAARVAAQLRPGTRIDLRATDGIPQRAGR